MSFAAPLGEATQRRVALPFVICTFVWGSTWFVIATQLKFVPPVWSITWRFVFGALAMFAVAAAMRQPLRLAAAAHPLAIMVGVPQFLLNYVFVYAAEGHMASGLVAIVSALLLVPNAVFGWMFLGQALSRRFLIGSAVAVAGLALLFAHELGRTGAGQWHIRMGVVLSVLAVFSASVANVLQGTKQAKALPPATLLAWSMAYGALADLALAFATGGPPRLPLDPVYLAGLAYLAVIGSALTFSLYFGLIRTIGPGRAGYVSVLTPVMAMLLSTLFEGYRWTPTAAAGVALALAGLVVAIRARSPAR